MDIIHAGRGLVVERRGEDKHDKGTSAMQNIFFTDIRIEQVTGTGGISRNPIQIDGGMSGLIGNIFFKRVSVGNFGPKPSLISGLDQEKSCDKCCV